MKYLEIVKILKVTDMVQLEQCKMGYKLCHNLLPSKLDSKYVVGP